MLPQGEAVDEFNDRGFQCPAADSSSSAVIRPRASELARRPPRVHRHRMEKAATFTARIARDGEWFVAFSPEFPEGNGQGHTEQEALDSLRESILLLIEDRREDARASLAAGEKLVPLALA